MTVAHERKEQNRRILVSVITAFVILGLGQVLSIYLVVNGRAQENIQRCIAANASREDINERFQRQTDFFLSLAPKNDPHVKSFVARQKADALKPRDCMKDPVGLGFPSVKPR